MNIKIEDIRQYIIENVSIEVKEVKNQDTSKECRVIATAKITIPGLITMKGYSYKTSKFTNKRLGKKVWIEPPKIPIGKKRDSMILIFFEDQELWGQIEKKIQEQVNDLDGGTYQFLE